MNRFITITIDPGDLATFARETERTVEEARLAAQTAMANTYWQIVQDNLGDIGRDRPIEWVDLSPKYAKRVGRAHATLLETGRLAANILTDFSDPAGFVISSSNARVLYATIHQTGGKKMPARPYFPMDEDGNTTPYTEAAVREAAREALQEVLK